MPIEPVSQLDKQPKTNHLPGKIRFTQVTTLVGGACRAVQRWTVWSLECLSFTGKKIADLEASFGAEFQIEMTLAFWDLLHSFGNCLDRVLLLPAADGGNDVSDL